MAATTGLDLHRILMPSSIPFCTIHSTPVNPALAHDRSEKPESPELATMRLFSAMRISESLPFISLASYIRLSHSLVKSSKSSIFEYVAIFWHNSTIFLEYLIKSPIAPSTLLAFEGVSLYKSFTAFLRLLWIFSLSLDRSNDSLVSQKLSNSSFRSLESPKTSLFKTVVTAVSDNVFFKAMTRSVSQ